MNAPITYFRIICVIISGLTSGRKQGIVFSGCSFRKGVRAPIGVPGGGFGVGFRWVVGVVFLWKKEGNREGSGEWRGVGWGQAKEPASRRARVCQNYPLAIYPLVSPQSCNFVREFLYRAHGRSGGQTAGGDSKAFPRLKQPLFAAPALRELESACRVSIL